MCGRSSSRLHLLGDARSLMPSTLHFLRRRARWLWLGLAGRAVPRVRRCPCEPILTRARCGCRSRRPWVLGLRRQAPDLTGGRSPRLSVRRPSRPRSGMRTTVLAAAFAATCLVRVRAVLSFRLEASWIPRSVCGGTRDPPFLAAAWPSRRLHSANRRRRRSESERVGRSTPRQDGDLQHSDGTHSRLAHIAQTGGGRGEKRSWPSCGSRPALGENRSVRGGTNVRFATADSRASRHLTAVRRANARTLVVVKQKGRWRIAQDQSTPIGR